MEFVRAGVLGLVQGVGEFLPISSSAHLVLLPWFLGWEYQGLSYDVALHFGTLLSLIAVFWRDWWTIVRDGLRAPSSPEGRRLWILAAASVPAALAGILLEDVAERTLRAPWILAASLIAFGLILGWADTAGRKARGLDTVTLKDAMLIGCCQALALIPGTSRAGITMTGGLALGLTREASARFSFLLSMPIVFGAAALKAKDIGAHHMTPPAMFGMAAAAVTGWLAIRFLLKLLSGAGSFRGFVVYRVVLGLVIFVNIFVRG